MKFPGSFRNTYKHAEKTFFNIVSTNNFRGENVEEYTDFITLAKHSILKTNKIQMSKKVELLFFNLFLDILLFL